MNKAPIDVLKALGNEPRFHGNGFVQLYIAPRRRLHIWTPELPPIRGHNAQVHDHRFDMYSHILHGKLRHTVFDVTSYSNGEYEILTVEGASKQEAKLRRSLNKFERRLRHHYIFAAGSTYTFKQHIFHESSADGFTVTKVAKSSEDSGRWASILVPIGTPNPTHAFAPEHQPPQEQLWSIIEQACNLCGKDIIFGVSL